MSKTTLDLSTLSDIADGAHTVKVKAKADGYYDSEFSNEVSYTKAPNVYNGYVECEQGSDASITVSYDGSSVIKRGNSKNYAVTTGRKLTVESNGISTTGFVITKKNVNYEKLTAEKYIIEPTADDWYASFRVDE